ncbi:MAG: terminase TerL endonuclease subunit [Clostridia bacterium]
MGEKVQLACQRYFDDLEKSCTPEYPWRFDEAKAARPIDFMERFLSPTKSNYERMQLLGWQCFVEANLYGWVDKKTELRRFREGLIIVGRGNGKSTMVSGNATYGSSKDGERGADIYLLANSKEQAGIVYEECQTQIRASRKLSPHFRVLRDGIHYDATNGRIRHRASDSRKLDGLNPHMGIFDEIHEYHDFKLINVIKRAMKKRRQPLAIYITTMGSVLDGPLMHYYNLFTDAMRGQLRPEIADRLFAFICELDVDDDIDDTSKWIKANPSLGVLISMEDMQNDWARCKLVPQERSDFVNKQLNIFTNAAEAVFADYDVIQRNNASIDVDMLSGRDCYGGFDLSTTEDFTAAALEFELDDGRVFILSHTWIPQKKVEIDNEKLPYYEYAMQGFLDIVPGEYIKQELVYDWFVEQSKKYNILTIGYDPANAPWIVRMLQAQGFACNVVRQGPLTCNGPMKDIRDKMLDGKLVYNNNPLFFWYLSNVRLRRDFYDREKENWYPSKRDRYRKIDGFMAFLDAHVEYIRLNPISNVDADVQVTVYSLYD